jgi:hypothetical protein
MVAYAMTLARRAPALITARRRIAVWDGVVFVLNVLALVLIGLQLRGILRRLASADSSECFVAAAAVCAVVIGVRIVFTMTVNRLLRWRLTQRPAPPGIRNADTRQRTHHLVVRNARHRDFGATPHLQRSSCAESTPFAFSRPRAKLQPAAARWRTCSARPFACNARRSSSYARAR